MRNPDKIALCIIAKNEQDAISRCLESVSGIVDFVFIGIDDSTTDATKSMADRHAMKFEGFTSYFFKWNDDFSEARNIGLKKASQCKAEWILTLDCDEYIDERAREFLHQFKVSDMSKIECVYARVVYSNGSNSGKLLSHNSIRLHRNNPKVSWTHASHNVLSGVDISRSASSRDFTIVHDRSCYSREKKLERSRQRNSMNIRNLMKEVKTNPGNSRAWFYLGNTYRECGMWNEAISAYDEYLKVGTWIHERYEATRFKAASYTAVGKRREAEKTLVDSIVEYPARAETFCMLGTISYDRGDYEKAAMWFKSAIGTEVPRHYLFIDMNCYTWLALDKLSMCYSKLGEYKKAVAAAEKSLHTSPDKERVRNNIKFWTNKIEENENTDSEKVFEQRIDVLEKNIKGLAKRVESLGSACAI